MRHGAAVQVSVSAYDTERENLQDRWGLTLRVIFSAAVSSPCPVSHGRVMREDACFGVIAGMPLTARRRGLLPARRRVLGADRRLCRPL